MERLIICGGGHVALELAHIAARLDFEVHVIDDRPEFANRSRFPMAQVYCGEFVSALEELGNGPDDYFAVLTRGHVWDGACVAQILRGEFGYLGMIGSRRKVAATRAMLLEEGFTAGQVDQVHAPIGLNIGGETPAEIAVSIAAQLVQVRAAHGGAKGPNLTGPGIVATIVEKEGSVPRGVGAAMLVAPDGTCTGTVGGGALEFWVKERAMERMGQNAGCWREIFDLGDGAELGMVCGGKVTVEFRVESGEAGAS